METKTSLMILGLLIAVGVVGLIFGNSGMNGNAVNGISVVVYKSQSCGCCSGYISALIDEGYDVDVKVIDDMTAIKDSQNIPMNMRSCHTVVIGDYFLEGHVPLEAVSKLLAEQPDVDGIVLPGMPSGAVGMSGPKTETFTVYSVKNGVVSEFMRI